MITKTNSVEVADGKVVNCEVYIKKEMDEQLFCLPHLSSYDISHGQDYVHSQDRVEENS